VNLILNGQARAYDGPATIGDLLAALGLAGRPVLVELNGTALPASERAAAPLAEGDRVEIIELAAGG
jgi:sulfur carrier protein